MDLKSAVLYIGKILEPGGTPVDRACLTKYLDRMEVGPSGLENTLRNLVASGDMTESDGGVFRLTDRGREKADIIWVEYQRDHYNQFMMRIWHSRAYLDFCEDLYGYRWCLLNSLYKEQFGHLFHELEIGPNDTVLDVGCGSGAIVSNLVGTYGCRGIGIDIARDLISVVKECYASVAFHSLEIERMHEAPFDADVIIGIDSLYACRDLAAVVAGLKERCRRQMYMFYTETVDDEHGDRSLLHVDGTNIARAFQANDLDYSALDFSADEWNLWNREKAILEKHRPAFEKEGNLKIWEGRVADTEGMLKLFGDTRAVRYLYKVTV